MLYLGKKDVLGTVDQDIFAGGDGTDQFVNQALIANPVFLLGLPYSLFYNLQATPWLNVTPDVQWIRPSAGALATDNAFVYGLRVNVTF